LLTEIEKIGFAEPVQFCAYRAVAQHHV